MQMKFPLKLLDQRIALDQVTLNWLNSAKTPSKAAGTRTVGTAKPTALWIAPQPCPKHKPKTLIKMEKI